MRELSEKPLKRMDSSLPKVFWLKAGGEPRRLPKVFWENTTFIAAPTAVSDTGLPESWPSISTGPKKGFGMTSGQVKAEIS
jgi:hypothetical protein